MGGVGGCGGGQIPYYYPCNPLLTSNFTGTPVNNVGTDPLPPCPPPSGGSGWNPSNIDPCNPLITSLKTNQTFKDKFLGLANNIPNPDNIETGEAILNLTNNYVHVEGTVNSPGFSILNLATHQAIIHRHFNDLNDMFSPADVWNMMAQVFGNNVNNPNDYFWGMIGPYGQPYIIKVKQASIIVAYMQNHNYENFDKNYAESFNSKFESQGNLNNRANESGFLNMLRKKGLLDAIELYRGNSSFNDWKKLGTNGRDVFIKNCL